MCVYVCVLSRVGSNPKKPFKIIWFRHFPRLEKLTFSCFTWDVIRLVPEREGKGVKDDHQIQDYFLEKIDIEILLRYNL